MDLHTFIGVKQPTAGKAVACNIYLWEPVHILLRNVRNAPRIFESKRDHLLFLAKQIVLIKR